MVTHCLGGTKDSKEDKGGPDRSRGWRRGAILIRESAFPAAVSSTPGDREDSRRQEKEEISGADRIRACKLLTRRTSISATGLSKPFASSLPCMETSISCTTFNILAPIFKRENEGCLESQSRDVWWNRNEKIIERLRRECSSIICLQEFWLGNEELVHLYEERLHRVGYFTFKLARTSDKGDGLLTAIKSDQITVLNYRELRFHDRGDRVAQFFHLQLRVPSCKKDQLAGGQQLLLVNTHLLFPHNSSYCLVRLWQVYKIIECLEHFKVEHGLVSVPVILCGDWNGSKHGHVYKFLCSQGFVSSYDGAHKNDAQQWVSHRNHRGNICGVDFIWLRNPSKHQQSLSSSWREAVLGILMAMLCEAGIPRKDLFDYFQPKENHIKLSLNDFQKRLHQLGLTRNCLERLSREEINDLMQTLYVDANDLIDHSAELEVTLPSIAGISNENGPLLSSGTISGRSATDAPNAGLLKEGGALEKMAGLAVQDAYFFPKEVEQGLWPQDYVLSDHASLTAIFKPSRVSE